MIRFLFFITGLILGGFAIYLYYKNKSNPASIFSVLLSIISLSIAIYPGILEQEMITPYIVIDNSSLELVNGDEYILNANTSPNNTIVEWSSSNLEIIDIDNKGNVKAINEGTAIITATMVYNNIKYSANCEINVKSPIEELSDNISKEMKTDKQEIDDLDDLNNISLAHESVAWLKCEKVYKDESEITMRGQQWNNCIRFGSSNLNADGCSIIIAACDQKYSKFTAQIAPQEGFDTSEMVTVYVYGMCDDEQVFMEEYQIDYMTKNITIDINISGIDELYIEKVGDYNMARVAGQFINGYTGMGVLMRDATLHK